MDIAFGGGLVLVVWHGVDGLLSAVGGYSKGGASFQVFRVTTKLIIV